MKTVSRNSLIAVLALLPAVAFSSDIADVEGCMQKFTQTYFPNSHATFVIPQRDSLLRPLELNTGTREVDVTVTSNETGKVVATGVCEVNENGPKRGSVVVSESLHGY